MRSLIVLPGSELRRNALVTPATSIAFAMSSEFLAQVDFDAREDAHTEVTKQQTKQVGNQKPRRQRSCHLHPRYLKVPCHSALLKLSGL